MTTGLIILIVAVLGLGAFWTYRSERDGRWHPMYFEKKMKRFIKGKWQYRDMTGEEFDKHGERHL